MEGDFRRPARATDGFSGSRPQPQPSQRAVPVTDLRPPAPPAAAQPINHPAPQYQPAVAQNPAAAAQTPPKPQPAPTTAELIARHEQESKPKPSWRRYLVPVIAGLIVIIAAALLFAHRGTAKNAGPFPASITASQITIPVYLPKNLPAGFKISGYKAVKQDVLNYVVTNQNNDSFYVNIQAIPAGYDFNAFNKRFTGPVTYPVDIGTATAGLMNKQLICSIKTDKSWVLINTTAIKDSADMATIAKALKPASL